MWLKFRNFFFSFLGITHPCESKSLKKVAKKCFYSVECNFYRFFCHKKIWHFRFYVKYSGNDDQNGKNHWKYQPGNPAKMWRVGEKRNSYLEAAPKKVSKMSTDKSVAKSAIDFVELCYFIAILNFLIIWLHWPTHFWLQEVWWSFSFHFVTLNAGLAFVLSLYVWILRGCQVLILH